MVTPLLKGGCMDPHIEEVHAARDRVRAVLRPWLGPDSSLERANNIAQAMLVGSPDAQAVAEELLRGSGLPDVKRISRMVVRAWYGVPSRRHPLRQASGAPAPPSRDGVGREERQPTRVARGDRDTSSGGGADVTGDIVLQTRQ